MIRILILMLCLLGCPGFAAAVSISEVAWMGETESANYEWIELYNPGEAVVVDGWSVQDGLNLNIALSGTIPASSYVVLMRNRASGVYPGGTPFVVYTGALVNTGATLVVRDASGTIIDQVAGGENWQNIGGDNATKHTAQYTSAGWRTGIPTPGTAPGALVSVPPPTTSTTTVTATTTTPAPPTNTGATTSGGGSNSKKSDTIKIVRQPNNLQLQPDIQKVAYVNQPIPFMVKVSGVGTTTRNSLTYRWNFGDLLGSSSSKPIHTYRYPGTYVVMVEVAFGQQRQIARHDITVLPVTLTLGRTHLGDIHIHNDAPYDVDLSAYTLKSDTVRTFPPYTIVPAKSTLTVPRRSIGAAYDAPVILSDAMRIPVAVWPVPQTETTGVVHTAIPASTVRASAPLSPETVYVPSAVVATATPMAPLVLQQLSDHPGIPAYVVAAFLPVSTPVVPERTVWWPYIALFAVVALAIGSIVASSSNMSSRLPKISTDTTAIHRE